MFSLLFLDADLVEAQTESAEFEGDFFEPGCSLTRHVLAPLLEGTLVTVADVLHQGVVRGYRRTSGRIIYTIEDPTGRNREFAGDEVFPYATAEAVACTVLARRRRRP